MRRPARHAPHNIWSSILVHKPSDLSCNSPLSASARSIPPEEPFQDQFAVLLIQMSSLLYFFVLIEAEPFYSTLLPRMSSLLYVLTSPISHVDPVYEITRHHPRLIKISTQFPSILQASSQRHLSIIQLSQSYLAHPTVYISVQFLPLFTSSTAPNSP